MVRGKFLMKRKVTTFVPPSTPQHQLQRPSQTIRPQQPMEPRQKGYYGLDVRIQGKSWY
jgi:hypothetical protein